jgi:hypothetical protein
MKQIKIAGIWKSNGLDWNYKLCIESIRVYKKKVHRIIHLPFDNSNFPIVWTLLVFLEGFRVWICDPFFIRKTNIYRRTET